MNALPTQHQLIKWHIISDSSRLLYNNDKETAAQISPSFLLCMLSTLLPGVFVCLYILLSPEKTLLLMAFPSLIMWIMVNFKSSDFSSMQMKFGRLGINSYLENFMSWTCYKIHVPICGSHACVPILKIDIDQSRVQSSHMPHFFSYLPLLNYIINLYGSFQKSTWKGGWSFLVYAVAVFLIDYHHGSISDCRDVEQAELRAFFKLWSLRFKLGHAPFCSSRIVWTWLTLYVIRLIILLL